MRRRFAPLILTIAVVTSACAGGGDDDSSESDATETTTTTSEVVAEPQELSLEVVGYFGFAQIEFTELTFTPDPDLGSGELVVPLEVTNLTDSDQTFDPEVNLDVDGTLVPLSGEVPTIPAGSTSRAELSGVVEQEQAAALDDAALVFGAATQNQLRIPLSDPGSSQLLEPSMVTIGTTKPIPNGGLDVTVQSADIHFGDHFLGESLDAGVVEIAVTFDVVAQPGAIGAGGENVQDRNTILVLPDGTTQAASSGPNEIIAADGRLTGLVTRFQIAGDQAGQYSMIYRSIDAQTEASFPFTVDPAPASTLDD